MKFGSQSYEARWGLGGATGVVDGDAGEAASTCVMKHDLETGNAWDWAPQELLTAEREKEPVVVYALNSAPTMLAKPMARISCVGCSVYWFLRASARAMEIDSARSMMQTCAQKHAGLRVVCSD